MGQQQDVAFSISNSNVNVGNKTVYSIKWQELDNSYVRFTYDYEMPAGLDIFVFNPPNGDLIGIWSDGTTSSSREQFQVDIGTVAKLFAFLETSDDV